MPIQNTDRLPTIAAFLIIIVLMAGFVPSLINNTTDVATQTVTQTEGNEYQLSGYLSADLTNVRDGQSFTEVASIHTTDIDFGEANTLDNVTVDGGTVSLQTGVFSDGFEDDAADSGTPDNWENSGFDSESVTTSRSYSGSQSYQATVSGSGDVRPSEQPYVTELTDEVSFAIYVESASPTYYGGVSLHESGTRLTTVQMRNGNLQYLSDSGFTTLSSTPNDGEWVFVRIYDIDTSTNTFAVDWETDSSSNTHTGLTFGSNPANGYEETKFGISSTTANIDEFQIGDGGGSTGTYVSETHSVNNAETGFTNITLSDANAVVTWEADTDGDGSFETEVSSDTRTSTGNYTADLSGTSGQNFRVNVTFVSNGETPIGELHDEGILTTTSEGTDVNVTLVDTKTGETVKTGPINESETRQFTIGFETVTVTNEDVLSDNRSLMTYEYPRYYGYNTIVAQFGGLIGLIIIVIFVYLMYSIFFPEEKQ